MAGDMKKEQFWLKTRVQFGPCLRHLRAAGHMGPEFSRMIWAGDKSLIFAKNP